MAMLASIGGDVRAGDHAVPPPDQAAAFSLGTDACSLYLRTGMVNLREKPSLLAADAIFNPAVRYVVQLDGPMTPQRRAFLEGAGVVLGQYLPMNAYVADMSRAKVEALLAAGFVRWVGEYEEAWKISPTIGRAKLVTPERRQLAAAGKRRVAVSLFPDADVAAARRDLARSGALLPAPRAVNQKRELTVDVTDAHIVDLARDPAVMFIEEALEAEPRNATTTWICQSNVTDSMPLWNAGLHGEDQIAGIIDWDLRADQCAFVDEVNPIGPLHRKIVSYYGMGISPGYGYHGTHVGGVLAGDELADTNPNLKGMAYKSRFVFQHYSGVLVGGVLYVNDRLTIAHNDGARVHSNSWGSDATRDYTDWPRDIDLFTRDNEDDVVVLAVTNGNIQVTIPDNSKNGLAVAATSDTPNQDSRCYGGHGLTTDGRQKPEVWAPGCGSYSADYYLACGQHSGGGTSYAAPAVSGFAVLARQYFMEGFYPSGTVNPEDAFTPSGALLKAVMVNSAVDMTGMAGYFTAAEGWGRILMDDILYFAGDARKLLLVDVRNAVGLSTGQTKSYYVQVDGSTERLKATLVWTDVPAALLAAFTPVNNLDLVVTAPDATTYLGNVFSGGQSASGGSADIRNNLEQVHRDSPAAGTWRIDVIGTAVNEEQQGFALVVTGDVSWSCANPECISDETPPSPDPMTFAAVPSAASTTSIAMTATTATDAISPPVRYYFSFVSGGEGGADSTWQLQTAYSNSGLSPNTVYTYEVKARDSDSPPNETGYSGPESAATYIETPDALSFGAVTDNSIEVSAPGTFTNLTENLSGLFVEVTKLNGAPIGGAQANTWVQTQTITATDLAPGITYRFRAKARNWYGQDETPWYPAAGYITQTTTGTAACIPCGDLDHDEDVDYYDHLLFRTAMGYSSGQREYDLCADLDLDGTVSLVDYQAWLECYREFIGDPLAPPPTIGPLGDVNADNTVDVGDIQLFIAVLLGADTDPAREIASDMDGSGLIDGIDIQLFINAVLGI